MKFDRETYYTMFNAFHHFSDPMKRELVKRMREAKSPVIIAEILQPTVLCLLNVIAMTTIGCILLTPFIRPFSFGRLFFTYVLPVNILTITADGVISVFKSRSVKQYKTLFADCPDGVKIFRLGNCIAPVIIIELSPPGENGNSNLEIQQAPHNRREHSEHYIALHHPEQ